MVESQHDLHNLTLSSKNVVLIDANLKCHNLNGSTPTLIDQLD